MLLSNLQNKAIITIEDGKKIGNIIDVLIDKNGNINEILVQRKHLFFFGGSLSHIKWNQIDKIGKDVILIKTIQ